MSRYSRLKGQITPMDLLLVAMVFFIGVGLFLLADFLAARNVIISKQTIYLSMEIDDRGSELISLLGATSEGMIHMEILGDMSAVNHEQYTKEGLEGLKGATESMGSGYSLSGLETAETPSTVTSAICIHDDTDSHAKSLAWPMYDVFVVSSQPGFRQLEGQSCKCHAGVDIPGRGKSVRAAASGTVRYAGEISGYGNTVIISHDGEWEGYETLYGHLDTIRVSAGDYVAKETEIGLSGSTGISVSTAGGDSAHLHFELNKDNKHLNPCQYLESSPSSCVVNDRCSIEATASITEEGDIYVTEVPVPGARQGSLKKTAELVSREVSGQETGEELARDDEEGQHSPEAIS